MRFFLIRSKDDRIHGVDYGVGAVCGRRHEFWTRDCKPILITEKEAETYGREFDLVEVTQLK